MNNLIVDNLIEDWELAVGLTIEAIENYTIDCDESAYLTVIYFSNCKFAMQRDQSNYTTTCGLIDRLNFERHLKFIKQ